MNVMKQLSMKPYLFSNIKRCLHKSADRNFFSTPQTNVNMTRRQFQFIREGLRETSIFSRLLQERVICVMQPIVDPVANEIIAQLLYLQSENGEKPIHMYINSPGGSVTAGLGIYDTMQYITAPITTWCVGQASSMGSLLLAAGTKDMRFSLPNSRIMVHQVSGQAMGQATDIEIQAEEILKLKKKLNLIYAKHTGQPETTIRDCMERDRYMSPEEAKTFGIIDNIAEFSKV